MSIQDDAEKYKRDRLDARFVALFGRFKVASTGPLMVYLDGSDVASPGVEVDGLSYSPGVTGFYFLPQGQLPVCLPTA